MVKAFKLLDWFGHGSGVCCLPPPVARELAPAGLRSRPKAVNSISLTHPVVRFWGRFASQREQAPSPQGSFSLYKGCAHVNE